jgi:hypothetical protein
MESDGHAMARRKFHENLLEVLPICRFPMPNTKKKKKKKKKKIIKCGR